MFFSNRKISLESSIDQEIEKFRKLMPKMALGCGVIQDGKIILQKIYSDALFALTSTFEIGSITKTFTGIVTSALIESGIISKNSLLSELLPHIGQSDLGSISILDLITHRSGIPSFPPGWVKNQNEFETFTSRFGKKELEEYLMNPTGLGKKGKFQYSNLGIAILGNVLETITLKKIETLYREYIWEKFEMRDTGIEIPGGDIVGHEKNGEMRNFTSWGEGVFIPAGGIISTIPDMLKFIIGNLGPLSYIQNAQIQEDRSSTGICWMMPTMIDKLFGSKNIIWHNGATPGFSSYIAIDRDKKNGIILLANQYTNLDFLGILLMRKIRKNQFTH